MTTIDVFNMAMDLLGTNPMDAVSDPTQEARMCNRNWDRCRKVVLRSHPWNFAIQRNLLAIADLTPPAFDFTSKFPLPPNYLRMTILGDDLDLDDWRLEGGFILTNTTSVSIGYVADVTDPTLWDAITLEAVATYLAHICCYKITQSQERTEQLLKIYERTVNRAKTIDSMEDPKKEVDIDVWMRARVGPAQGFVRDPMT